MSRKTEAKKARRRKRRAARDDRWIPDSVLDGLADDTVIDLDDVNELLTERGWVFDDEESNENLVSWVYPPSAIDVEDLRIEPVTRMWMVAADDGEVLQVVLVGLDAIVNCSPAEFFESLEVIEAYRHGQPEPGVGSRQDPG